MAGYNFDRVRVLVVDDNVHMRRLVVAILQAFGVHGICEAISAESGWDMLREHNPDIVILDWVMGCPASIWCARSASIRPRPILSCR
jgi:two-component system, chemotaxis family, chemotaxis protein CheY